MRSYRFKGSSGLQTKTRGGEKVTMKASDHWVIGEAIKIGVSELKYRESSYGAGAT